MLLKIVNAISPIRLFLLLMIALAVGPSPSSAENRDKVLVVFSYERDSLWEIEIRKGLEDVLSDQAELTFFYMNTKVDLSGGPERAAEAYRLFKQIKPDGVIAVDDHAQSMFVVPYLKNKTSVPVVFCGVNADPESYGYPADNVSGVLERFHFEESLALNRQLAGRTETFVVMVNRSPLADLVEAQLEKDKDNFSARLVALLQPRTLEEAISMAKEYREQVDLLMLLTLKGLIDDGGKPVSDEEAISKVVSAFNKPTAATAAFAIKKGVLSGVLASGQEQGQRAAFMLEQAMKGVPLRNLPISRIILAIGCSM